MLLREGQVRIPSGCAITGIINKNKKSFSGIKIIQSITLMHERSNGLGGGFAAYGIYPDYKDFYAIHMFFDNKNVKCLAEEYLNEYFEIVESGEIPVRKTKSITDIPLIWRYFVIPTKGKLIETSLDEEEYIVRFILHVNANMQGAFVVSAGKNMGVFKGVGYPEDIGEFYGLDNYKAYLWTAHGRFPTNTPGWWGGAHPFSLLDMTVVHNGEISSYDTNRKNLEMYGYKCSLQTDTEVITYIFDLLLRRHNLPLDIAVAAIASPFWRDIERMEEPKKSLMKKIRFIYSGLLVNGPFSIIFADSKGLVALNDRLKLRSMVAAQKDDFVYVASEESAVRVICENPDRIWAPQGGEAVSVQFTEEQSLC